MASNSFKVDLRGNKELQKLLLELPKRVVKKGMRSAQNKAATPMLKTAKQLAPRDTGLLRKSLKRKQKTYASGTVVTIIGPDRDVTAAQPPARANGKTRRKVPANYSHLVEGGHGGPHPAAAHPFMKPAFESNEGNSAEIMKRELLETLYREAEKQK